MREPAITTCAECDVRVVEATTPRCWTCSNAPLCGRCADRHEHAHGHRLAYADPIPLDV